MVVETAFELGAPSSSSRTRPSASRAIASAREGGRLRLRGRALAVERPAGAPDDADRPPRHDYEASPYEPPRQNHDPNAPPRLATEPGRLGLPLAALSLADVPVDQRPLGGWRAGPLPPSTPARYDKQTATPAE